MQIISDTNKMAACIKKMKNKGSIGFVPTMGCLHEGHVSLIRKSRQKCDKIIVSIFVNPLQFGPKEDYSKYPRPKNEDILICKENGVDILFLPDEKNFYSKDFSTRIDENKVSKNFCGSFRPSHFSGVLTVVANLLNIVLPDYLFLGQKDYQQCLVIKRMIRDLNFQVKVIICPTVREKSGLAMSSRNKYLSARDKERASLIYKSLVNTKRRILENYKNLSLKNIAI
ncbi:MAG: pantoate-beta-alanine ligase, partial [uncultured bacterium]